MAITVHCTGFNVHENGTRIITFEDGTGLEFPDLATVIDQNGNLDAPDQIDLAHKLLICWFLVQNPEADNGSVIVGRSLTFNMSSAVPILLSGGG